MDLGWGSPVDRAGGAYSAPPDSQMDLRGLLLRGAKGGGNRKGKKRGACTADSGIATANHKSINCATHFAGVMPPCVSPLDSLLKRVALLIRGPSGASVGAGDRYERQQCKTKSVHYHSHSGTSTASVDQVDGSFAKFNEFEQTSKCSAIYLSRTD